MASALPSKGLNSAEQGRKLLWTHFWRLYAKSVLNTLRFNNCWFWLLAVSWGRRWKIQKSELAGDTSVSTFWCNLSKKHVLLCIRYWKEEIGAKNLVNSMANLHTFWSDSFVFLLRFVIFISSLCILLRVVLICAEIVFHFRNFHFVPHSFWLVRAETY